MRTRRLVVLLALGAPRLLVPDARIALVGDAIEIAGLPPESLAHLRAGERTRQEWERLVRVSVASESELPPVLGSYAVSGAKLVFRPRFPFRPGMTYEVTIDASLAGEEVRGKVSLPAPDLAPSTVVRSVYPTSERLPENQLKLYVQFSAPMAGGDGLPHVRLLDGEGREVADPFLPLGEHFWDRDRERYTIFFDPGRVKRGILPNDQMGRPLVPGERYRLVVDSAWRDAAGLPLAEPFEKSFVAVAADETPLDPKTWKLTEPFPGTRGPLVIDFGEPLDHALLERALFVEDFSGAPVAGEVATALGETRWTFTPERFWEPGAYAVVVLGVLEDLAGNRIGRPFEVDVFDPVDGSGERERHRVSFSVGAAPR